MGAVCLVSLQLWLTLTQLLTALTPFYKMEFLLPTLMLLELSKAGLEVGGSIKNSQVTKSADNDIAVGKDVKDSNILHYGWKEEEGKFNDYGLSVNGSVRNSTIKTLDGKVKQHSKTKCK